MGDVLVKICGVNSPEAVEAALAAGSDMIGFMFYPPSPRAVSPETAAALGTAAAGRAVRVAVLVDPEDPAVDAAVGSGVVDMLQLHGGETPERVAALKARTGLPVMKVIRVETREDVTAARAYDGVADRIMFDAKAPKGMKGALPGGNALAFDWRLLDGLTLGTPWILAGGLDAGNVATAIRLTRAPAVDTSSGVEDRPGAKNPEKIREFVSAAKATARTGADTAG